MWIVKVSGRFAVNGTALWVMSHAQLAVGVVDKKWCYGRGSLKESDMQPWCGFFNFFFCNLYHITTQVYQDVPLP